MCASIFGAIVLKPRFKIDVIIMIICSIVIIINSVLTLQVSTASLPHDCGPCKIKVVFIHTWFASYLRLRDGPHRVRIRLSGLINGRNQIPFLGISSSIPFWSESVPNSHRCGLHPVANLPWVSWIPVVLLDLRISPQIFQKIWNDSFVIFRRLFMKKT